MTRRRIIVASRQSIVDSGLNVFAFILLAESFSKERVRGLDDTDVVVRFEGKDGKPVFVTLSSRDPTQEEDNGVLEKERTR